MLTFEDKYSGKFGGITEFDFEAFVENVVRLEKEIDVFTYTDNIIRPRHLIALNDVFRSFPDAELYLGTNPVVTFDGKPYEMYSRTTATFEDMLKHVEDTITSQKFSIFYNISRHTHVDNMVFEPVVRFKIRYANTPLKHTT